jgi:hypothetical protein
MTYSARTVTPRVLTAHVHRHELSLRVFSDTADWNTVPRPAIVGDPEWIYHESAMQACATVSARLLAEAQGLDRRGVRDRAVTPQGVSVTAYLHEVRGTVQRVLTTLRGGGLDATA